MSMCYRCNLPAFDGASSYAGPQCKCWAHYAPTEFRVRYTQADDERRANERQALKPVTEEDVRRIVGETKLPHPGSPEAAAMIDSVLAEYGWPANSKNAARAGYEAARRLLDPNLSYTTNLSHNKEPR